MTCVHGMSINQKKNVDDKVSILATKGHNSLQSVGRISWLYTVYPWVKLTKKIQLFLLKKLTTYLIQNIRTIG